MNFKLYFSWIRGRFEVGMGRSTTLGQHDENKVLICVPCLVPEGWPRSPCRVSLAQTSSSVTIVPVGLV